MVADTFHVDSMPQLGFFPLYWQSMLVRNYAMTFDHNVPLTMIKSWEDRMGPSSILSGTKLSRWLTLEEKWSLMDAWKIGPWQAHPSFPYHSLQYMQTTSCLNRVYFLHNANWVPWSLQMEIITGESLSDHSLAVMQIWYLALSLALMSKMSSQRGEIKSWSQRTNN